MNTLKRILFVLMVCLYPISSLVFFWIGFYGACKQKFGWSETFAVSFSLAMWWPLFLAMLWFGPK